MRRNAIAPTDLPLGRLPFSPAIRANGFVFVSGQASTDADGAIVSDTFEGEMRRAFANVAAVLAAAGLTLDDVVQVRGYLRRGEDFAEYNRIYQTLFSPPYPARTTIANCLGEDIQFEVDVVAAERPNERS